MRAQAVAEARRDAAAMAQASAETRYVGHATPAGLQRLLARAVWDPDRVRDEVRDYVVEHLGAADGGAARFYLCNIN